SLLSHETFLSGVTAAPPQRRLWVLMVCGVVAGLGWWTIYRYGRPLVSIKQAVSPSMPSMPPKTTLAHSVLQIITVALGSPLGREV
ncbi:chloride channel protein, partial [Salmonella enterica subsp. enterica]|nr:chloride channel protein [Salmonella enterica]